MYKTEEELELERNKEIPFVVQCEKSWENLKKILSRVCHVLALYIAYRYVYFMWNQDTIGYSVSHSGLATTLVLSFPIFVIGLVIYALFFFILRLLGAPFNSIGRKIILGRYMRQSGLELRTLWNRV